MIDFSFLSFKDENEKKLTPEQKFLILFLSTYPDELRQKDKKRVHKNLAGVVFSTKRHKKCCCHAVQLKQSPKTPILPITNVTRLGSKFHAKWDPA